METTSPTSLAYLSFSLSLSPLSSPPLYLSPAYICTSISIANRASNFVFVPPTAVLPCIFALLLLPSPRLSLTLFSLPSFFRHGVRRCARDDGVVRRRLREQQRDPLQRRRCCRSRRRRRRRRGARFECSSFPSFLASSRVSREGEGMKEGPCERARGGKERMNTYTCITSIVCDARARA